METLLLIIAFVTLVILLFTLTEFFIGFNKIRNIIDQSKESSSLPKLSIIFSALNEEKDIKNALTSLLNLNYPDFEIIAINDRSTDNTPHILDDLQNKYPHRLRVFHVQTLPPGWFGKNHALSFGSEHARGEWLLFTDADVLMKNDLLIQAMNYVIKNKIDHLTIAEKHLTNCFWLQVFYLGKYVTYNMAFKPWRASFPWSKTSIGHGAFNLVKKSSYVESGGHAAIALECLDDLALGQIIKKKGFKQDTINGYDFIERNWYQSLPDLIHGLQKNGFAFYRYRLLPAMRDIFFAMTFYIWPFFGAVFLSGLLQKINILNILFTLLLFLYIAKQFKIKKYYALFYPAAIAILIFAMINSIIATLKNKGVIWRGTLYSLEQLKKMPHYAHNKKNHSYSHQRNDQGSDSLLS